MIIKHAGVAQTHKAWAADYGIPPRLILARLDCGWPIAVAIETPMECPPGYQLPDLGSRETEGEPREGRRGRQAKLYTFDSNTLTLVQWSALSGIDAKTLAARLRKGWSIRRTLTEKSQRQGQEARMKGGGYVPTSADRLGDRPPRETQDRT